MRALCGHGLRRGRHFVVRRASGLLPQNSNTSSSSVVSANVGYPCIYCPADADSIEHPLIAALGEFEDAPLLRNRICTACNNKRLGILDEQYARCGPESFLRRHYGIQGRAKQPEVNPFYRGSAGGQRLELLAYDEAAGFHVLMECENGTYQQVRQLIFFDEDGTVHHLPIRHDSTAETLKAAYDRLEIKNPVDVRMSCSGDDWEWVETLVRQTWPSVVVVLKGELSRTYDGGIVNLKLSDRYFRAVAKMGFHYFLTQFPELSGTESLFAGIRQFITEDRPVVEANRFLRKRNFPLLGPMLVPGARPGGWRAHVLAAEIKAGQCLAHVQTFLTEDWPAPIYTVALGSVLGVTDRAAGHLYVYNDDGPKGKFAGVAYDLTATRVPMAVPPSTPVIREDY